MFATISQLPMRAPVSTDALPICCRGRLDQAGLDDELAVRRAARAARLAEREQAKFDRIAARVARHAAPKPVRGHRRPKIMPLHPLAEPRFGTEPEAVAA